MSASARFRALGRREVSTTATVAALSLVSRVLALALLVPAARGLSVDGFGVFALVTGSSVAAAGVLGAAVGDPIATGAVRDPVRTQRRVAAAALVLCGLGLIGPIAGFALDGLSAWFRTASLTATGIVPFLVMHHLRGLGRPVTGAVLAFLVLPVVRLLAIAGPVGDGPGGAEDLLDLLVWAGLACAVAAVVVLWQARPQSGLAVSPATSAAVVQPLALAAGAMVAVTFMVVGQTAPVSLAIAVGDAAAGTYVPTARVCEALTAVGVGYQFAVSRRVPDPASPLLPPRMIGLLASGYAAAALVAALVAPSVLPVLLGPGYSLETGVAAALMPAFFCTMASAAEIQRLFLVGRCRVVLVASVLAVAVAGIAVPSAAASFGANGAAIATAVAASSWWATLRWIGRRGAPC